MIARQKGFTLVELLIAVSLLSLVITTASYAYLQFASRWNKELGDFQSHVEIAKAAKQVQSVLKGVIPYVVVDDNERPQFYFVGSERVLLGVTLNGLATGESEVFRLSILESDVGMELVYQSLSLNSFILQSTEQEIPFSFQVTLLKDINSAAFEYFGWSSLALKAGRIPGTKAAWFTRYSALEREITPESVRLKLDTLHISAELDREPTRWSAHYRKGF